MTDIICPKCGRSSKDLEFIEAFCIDCYPVSLKYPPSVDIQKCKRCDRMFIQGEWHIFNLKFISKYFEKKCKGDFKKVGYNPESQYAEFEMANGSIIKRVVPFNIQISMCPNCNKKSGGYFEAIIQLRGDPKRIEKQARMLLDRLEKTTFITKTEEKDGGIDLYVGNSRAVVAVMHEVNERVLITTKLVGADQGRRLFRTTFLLRLESKKKEDTKTTDSQEEE